MPNMISCRYKVFLEKENVNVELDSHDLDSLLMNTSLIYVVLNDMISKHNDTFDVNGMVGKDVIKYLVINRLQNRDLAFPEITLDLDYKIMIDDNMKEIEDEANYFNISVETENFANVMYTFAILLADLITSALKELHIPIGDVEVDNALDITLDVDLEAFPVLVGNIYNQFHQVYHANTIESN